MEQELGPFGEDVVACEVRGWRAIDLARVRVGLCQRKRIPISRHEQ